CPRGQPYAWAPIQANGRPLLISGSQALPRPSRSGAPRFHLGSGAVHRPTLLMTEACQASPAARNRASFRTESGNSRRFAYGDWGSSGNPRPIPVIYQATSMSDLADFPAAYPSAISKPRANAVVSGILSQHRSRWSGSSKGKVLGAAAEPIAQLMQETFVMHRRDPSAQTHEWPAAARSARPASPHKLSHGS